MKKLLALLFSLFFLSSPSVFADDILELEIEGISIGDSLLDYMTEEEILNGIERSENSNYYHYLNEPYKYSEVYIFDNLQKYDALSFFIKNTPKNEYITSKKEKYTILSLRGSMPYIQDFKACLKEKDEVSKEISIMFLNADKREDRGVNKSDPSGKSINDGIWFNLDSGALVGINCSNWDEDYRKKENIKEGLNIQIFSKEIVNWLRN